ALAITSDPAPPLPPSLPPEFAAVIMRCMEKEAAKRYSSIAELAAALKPFAKALPADEELDIARVLSRPNVAAPSTDTDAVDTKIELDGHVVTTLRSATASIGPLSSKSARPMRWILLGVGGAVVLAIGIGVVLHGRGEATAPSPSTPPETRMASPVAPIDASVPVIDNAATAVAVPVDAAAAPTTEAPTDAAVDTRAEVPESSGPIKKKPRPRNPGGPLDGKGLSKSRY
ncbi:MAG TPA: hypothetical protein VLB44_07940, partial [Kofleriaceae bacterium]|nr:hypothetical protein [Kofleriaceae bacterium]